MILLPNGCDCSEPTVNPTNWQTSRASIKKPWYIQYYFRDPLFKDKYPQGKYVVAKGMNRLKTLEERREATEILIENELYMLRVEGFNPITGKYKAAAAQIEYEIEPDTLLCTAVNMAYDKIELAPKTLTEIKSAKKYFIKSANQLRFDLFKISDIKRKHVRAILENQSNQNEYTNNRYNSVRSYVMMLFDKLLEYDAIEYNPVASIPKKKTIKKIRDSMSLEEVAKVKDTLKEKKYDYYRFIEIFFHSGCRTTELLGVQKKDVDLKARVFKITVLKGGVYSEEMRAISNNALPFWIEIMEMAGTDTDYLFSSRLVPGVKRMDRDQISRLWKRHVKDKLGITADFYSLKHLHTTMIINEHGKELAANINGHKSSKMNDEHYDLLAKKRLLEAAKNSDVEL